MNNLERARPVTKYTFTKSANNKSAYILSEHVGNDIKDFPAMYGNRGDKKGENKNCGYIRYGVWRVPRNKNKRQFDMCLELANSKCFTGVNINRESPCRTYGDDKNLKLNDCVLIEFSKDMQTMTIYFYKDMADSQKDLYELWNIGKLSTTVECNYLPLEKETVTSSN